MPLFWRWSNKFAVEWLIRQCRCQFIQDHVAIRQIAALPYRIDDAAGFSILLVTSRNTGRWIVPKGNHMTGLAPHEAAAREAEEEAGVLGAISPMQLGTFTYRKIRNNGVSLIAEVSVFPLAVATELDEWLEAAQRKRRWFPIEEAAAAVNEPELAALIRSFGSTTIASIDEPAGQNAVSTPRKEIVRWLRSIMSR